jgi:hypothetical protein
MSQKVFLKILFVAVNLILSSLAIFYAAEFQIFKQLELNKSLDLLNLNGS